MTKIKNYIKDEQYVDFLSQYLNDCDSKILDKVISIFDILQSYNIDDVSLVATALFVVHEDKEVDFELISKQFDDNISGMLNNLKGVGIKHANDNVEEFENIRNMLVVMSKDIRVLIILLAYNLYKLEHLEELPEDERRIFVKSVHDIYAPLSARFSLNTIKNRMEDACFKFLDPEMYEQLSRDERLNKEERQEQVNIIIERIKNSLEQSNIKGKVYGREKHLASVYNKLKNKNLTLGQIYDLMAVRVIVDTIEECYMVLGKVNALFNIIPSRFKDYIATPKPNGYQSIHTCILAENNRPVEVQIRTQKMHHFNEYGVAAHWIYKDKGHKASSFDKSINWLKEIIDENKDLSSQEFAESIKMDMFNSEIYAQTPNGKIIKFPVGANCIDFAYAVHTNIGNRCVGAKLNGKFVPLTTEIKNGDVCEILLGSENKGPSRDWLKVVKTNSARTKINNYFKKEFIEDNIRNGKSIFEASAKNNQVSVSTLLSSDKLGATLNKYSLSTIEELYAMIGSGKINGDSVVRRLMPQVERVKENREYKPTPTKNNILVDNSKGMMTRFAKCCLPLPGDDIIGFVSLGKGVTVHRSDCINVKTLDSDRFIPVSWDDNKAYNYLAKVRVIGKDIVLASITNLIDKLGIKLMAFEVNPINVNEYFLTLSLKSSDELNKAINKIRGITNVQLVERV